jgi:hypothetical protein
MKAGTLLILGSRYKLWVDRLNFASNELTSIDLHRSDSLEWLTLWAPNLRSLGLQACYGLDHIAFLETHPFAARLPSGHAGPLLQVSTLNSNLGPRSVTTSVTTSVNTSVTTSATTSVTTSVTTCR